MRLYSRKNIKSLAYLLAGVITFKLVMDRSEIEIQRKRAKATENSPDSHIDLLGQSEQLLASHDKENVRSLNVENGRIHHLGDLEDDYDYDDAEDLGPDMGDSKVEDIQRENKEIDNIPLVRAPVVEVTDDDLKFFEEREKVYRERRELVQRVCKSLGEDGSYGNIKSCPLKRLRWLVSHKMLMCFNAKVGTSTWMQYLMEAGFPGVLQKATHWHYTAERYLKPPKRRSNSDSLDLLKEYGKVMIVRDPFARIVSAYLDKIATRSFAKLCRFIIGKYRKGEVSDDKYPTFEEFVRFLVEYTATSDNVWAKKKSQTDRHWFHYYANCFPCDLEYDVIATMETIHDDTRYIMKKYKLGLSDTIWGNHRGSSSSEDKALAFFQALPRNLTEALYQRYKVDFLMFGYSHEKYLAPN